MLLIICCLVWKWSTKVKIIAQCCDKEKVICNAWFLQNFMTLFVSSVVSGCKTIIIVIIVSSVYGRADSNWFKRQLWWLKSLSLVDIYCTYRDEKLIKTESYYWLTHPIISNQPMMDLQYSEYGQVQAHNIVGTFNSTILQPACKCIKK